MRIRRRQAQPALISLVSAIDVLMILLIFFMVTSTYLDLGMVPMAEADDAVPQAAEPAEAVTPLLIRLGPDGMARVQGRAQDAGALADLLRAHLAQHPQASVLVLPSGHASAQALVSLLDVATAAGVRNLRILRLEAVP
jgi:biopolymer transport protein ExbD